MKQVLKVLSALAVVGATAVGLSSCGGSSKGKFIIGCSGPLTGDAAIYGIAVQKSAQLAIDEINANGGVLGAEFKLKMYDDVCEGTKAATNYATLLDDGMQVSLGCVTSGACLEFAKSAAKDKVFCITPSATNDNVPTSGSNMYQMCFSDSGQGSGAATYITNKVLASNPNTKIGVFYDVSDAYSKGIYENFKNTFNGTITATASYTSDTKDDFSSQVETLKNCDFIFMPIYYTPAALFITQAKSVISNSAVYFGCDGLDGIESVKGFDVNSFTQEISYLSHFNAASTETATSTFVTNYVAKNGKESLNQFGAAAYDCVYAIKGAMEKAVSNGKTITTSISAKDLCAILEETFQGGYTYSGVTGSNMTWNQDGTVSKEPTKYVVNENRAK